MTRNKIIDELNLVPDYKLAELYDLIHYFRLELQQSTETENQIMEFDGCWNDMPEKIFNEFTEEIILRRKQAFSRRRDYENQ